jgi:quercetin dioxygenase-like cupin family protein
MSRALQENPEKRASLLDMQDLMEAGISEGHIECAKDQTSLRHFFTPAHPDFCASIYARELTMPAGLTVVGKLHRHAHLTFVTKGKMIISSEEGQQTVEAPATFVSPSGIKRAFHILEDAVLTTVHLTQEAEETAENLASLEGALISPTYESMGLITGSSTTTGTTATKK